MREDGKVAGRIKEIQMKNETIKSATAGDKVAMAIEGVTIGRQINENDTAYTFISPEDMKQLSPEELTLEELNVLKEIKRIKRGKLAQDPT